jgi:protein N-terminal methyltransferase
VTEGLLLRVSEYVDIIEPISKFTASLESKQGVRSVFNVGLEDWQPNIGREYDLIWLQWCLGHLTDEQLLRFLVVSKTVLNPITGLIVVKENLSTSETDLFDNTDSSVTR